MAYLIHPARKRPSYLQASLFFREMREFGALWHGVSWDEHEIIYSSRGGCNFHHSTECTTFREIMEKCYWTGERPGSWKPSVIEHEDTFTVRFYSCRCLEVDAIYLNNDIYARGDHTSGRFSQKSIAEGPGGYIFQDAFLFS